MSKLGGGRECEFDGEECWEGRYVMLDTSPPMAEGQGEWTWLCQGTAQQLLAALRQIREQQQVQKKALLKTAAYRGGLSKWYTASPRSTQIRIVC